jgi:hypothetical protein
LYGVAVYGSYKYGIFTKAQKTLTEVKDQRAFLYERHQEIADKYDNIY